MRVGTAAISFVAVLFALTHGASAQAVTWTGTAGGLWSEADNWDPKVVPNNAPPTTFYNVSINTSGPVVDGGFTIAGLAVDGTVALNEGSNLGFQAQSGGVVVSGNGEININVAAPSAPTSLVLGSPVTLVGGGRITMGGAGTARIVGGPVSLFNSSWTIAGEGRLIEGFASLSNFGTISASSGTLLVRAAGLNNANIMRAISSGTLHIVGSSGTFDNVGGTVLASGGLVQFSGNLHVTGGTLRSESGGSFETIASGGGTHRLRDINNEADFFITGSTVELQDEIFNTATFTLNGGNMRIVDVVDLDGGGTIVMNPGTVIGGAGTLSQVILRNGTIRGAGSLGNNQTAVLLGDLGKVQATGGTLLVDSRAGGPVNAGTFVADGGTLVILGSGTMINSSGRIRAEDGLQTAVVFGGDIAVSGGTIEAVGIGSVRVGQNDTARFANLSSLSGHIVLENSSTAVCTGEFQGSYQIFMEPGAKIEVEGSARFGTFGQILPDGAVIRPREPQFSDGPGSYLWVNDGILEGNVFISDLQIENNGTIRAVDGDQITVKPSADGLVNKGDMEARGTGTIILDGAGGGSLTQQAMGSIAAVDSSSTVRTANNPTLSGGRLGAGAGSFILSGTTTLDNVISEARLVQAGSGSLIISGSVVNNGSLTIPATSRLLVGGSLTIGSGGTGHYNNGGSIIIGSGGSFNNAGPGALLDAGMIVGTGTVTVQTGGTLRAHAFRQNRLTIADGASVELKSATPGSLDPSRIGSLTIGATAQLDVTNRVLILDQSGPGPLATLRSQIVSGHNGGTWDGPGIRSSTAAATPGHGIGFGEASTIFTSFPANYFGQTIDNTTLLVTYTPYGDANLDRVVGLDDFNRLAANFGLSNRTWTQGDFTYDTLCNLADFNAMAGNFGVSAGLDGPTPRDWAALNQVVPETGVMSMLLGFGLIARRQPVVNRARAVRRAA